MWHGRLARARHDTHGQDAHVTDVVSLVRLHPCPLRFDSPTAGRNTRRGRAVLSLYSATDPPGGRVVRPVALLVDSHPPVLLPGRRCSSAFVASSHLLSRR